MLGIEAKSATGQPNLANKTRQKKSSPFEGRGFGASTGKG